MGSFPQADFLNCNYYFVPRKLGGRPGQVGRPGRWVHMVKIQFDTSSTTTPPASVK